MEASSVEQIKKRLYKNNTGGWVGVVTLNHKGEETGVSIEPFGTIWLSDAEAILTARAPSDPKDNPFEVHTFYSTDAATGAKTPMLVRPVELASSEDRYVPADDRFVPFLEGTGNAEAEAAARADEPGGITPAAAQRTQEIIAGAGDASPAPTLSPASGPPAASPPSANPSAVPEPPPPTPDSPVNTPVPGGAGDDPYDATGGESWSAEPVAPGEVLPGQLGGSDMPSGANAPDVAPAAPVAAPALPSTPPLTPGGGDFPAPDGTDIADPVQAPPAPHAADPATPPVAAPGVSPFEQAAYVPPVAEETASTDIAEETGAAVQPQAEPPQGEYAQAEEVGSPEAPGQVNQQTQSEE